MGLDQANTKKKFSMSQPELDTDDQFDIPSPPPVASKTSESPVALPKQSQASVPQPVATEPQTSSSTLFDVHKEPEKAPIASIPQLQLHNEELNVPVEDNSTAAPAARAKPTQAASSLPASQPPVDHRAALVDSVSTGLPGNDPPEQSHTQTEICHSESTSVRVSHQPDASAAADSPARSGESFLTRAVTELRPDADSDRSALTAGSAGSHRESPVSHTEGSALQDVITPAVSSKKVTRSVSQEVYGELYDSLFPQNFSSATISPTSNHPPEIRTEMRQFDTKSQAVMVKIRSESHTEGTVIVSHLSTDNLADRKVSSSQESSLFTTYQSSAASELTPTQPPPLSTSSAPQPVCQDICFSEVTHSHSEVKLDNLSLIQETERPVPAVKDSAPPVSDYVTSHGADTRVTDSKRRVILVKEVSTDEASADPTSASLVFDKMSAIKGLEIKSEAMEIFPAPSGQRDVHDTLLSPSYLSVGSDDGSAMEIYYSAEEDNGEASGNEEMYTIDERENCTVDGVKEVQLCQGQVGIPERQQVQRCERDFKVVIVKMQNEEEKLANEKKTEDLNWPPDAQQRGGKRAETEMQIAGVSELEVSNDARARVRAGATTAQMTGEREEGRKEELPATPVEQVNTLTVCKVVPPSNEPHGQGEGSEENQTKHLETEAHLNGEKQLPSQEIQYLAHKDVRSSEYVHATSNSSSRMEDVITPTFREAEKHVSLTTVTSREVSVASIETKSDTTTNAASVHSDQVQVATGAVTDSAGLQSGATHAEHNRTLRSEGVDTVTQSAGGNTTVHEQVSVELSASKTDRPDTGAAEGLIEGQEHLSEALPDGSQG